MGKRTGGTTARAEQRISRHARERVGETAGHRLRWILALLGRDLADPTLTEDDVKRVCREAEAFAYGGAEHVAPILGWESPSLTMVITAQTRARTVISELRQGRVGRIDAREQTLLVRDATGSVRVLQGGGPFPDAFMGQLRATFAGLAPEHLRLRFCDRCGQPFVAQKHGRFCSDRCAQAVRISRYRARRRMTRDAGAPTQEA